MESPWRNGLLFPKQTKRKTQGRHKEDTRKTWTFIWSHHDETASFSTQTKRKSHHNRTTSFLLAKPKGGTQLGVKEWEREWKIASENSRRNSMCFFQHKPNGSFMGDKGAEGESKRVQWRHHDWTALFLTLIAYTWGTKGEKDKARQVGDKWRQAFNTDNHGGMGSHYWGKKKGYKGRQVEDKDMTQRKRSVSFKHWEAHWIVAVSEKPFWPWHINMYMVSIHIFL